jgi:hypothetical protein
MADEDPRRAAEAVGLFISGDTIAVSTAPAETALHRLVAPSQRRCGATVAPVTGAVTASRAAALPRPLVRYFLRDRGTAIQ